METLHQRVLHSISQEHIYHLPIQQEEYIDFFESRYPWCQFVLINGRVLTCRHQQSISLSYQQLQSFLGKNEVCNVVLLDLTFQNKLFFLKIDA